MKFFGLFTLLLFAPILASDVPDNKLDEGLIAYYSFNACDATDDSGNGSDGVVFGDAACWCGIEEDALLLDGNDDYIEFKGLVNRYFSTSDFTLSFYFKANQYSVTQQSLFSKKENCEKEYALDLYLDQNKHQVKTELNETPEKDYGDISPETGGPGWKHFVLVRRGIRAYTYINGVLQREGRRCSGVDISNDANLCFANSPCLTASNTRRFRGLLDELRVYDRALSDLEVSLLYNLHPVENAEQDCLSFVPKKIWLDDPNSLETTYLCRIEVA